MTSLGWERQRLARATLLPLVLLRLPMGDRWYGVVYPADTLSFGTEFDGAVDFDADVLYDGGSPAVHVGARLITVDGLEESALASDADVVAAWGQSARPRVTAELANEREEFSILAGTEYLLNQVGRIYFTFPGLLIAEAELKLGGTVQRWTLTKGRLSVEVEVP